MMEQTIFSFTEEEEEWVNLLIGIGTKKNIAKIIVFLANISEATSHSIERGIDMRQPEVSTAIKYLTDRQWIKCREIPSERKGRPTKNYSLAVPVEEIMETLEKERTHEINDTLCLIKDLRKNIS